MYKFVRIERRRSHTFTDSTERLSVASDMELYAESL